MDAHTLKKLSQRTELCNSSQPQELLAKLKLYLTRISLRGKNKCVHAPCKVPTRSVSVLFHIISGKNIFWSTGRAKFAQGEFGWESPKMNMAQFAVLSSPPQAPIQSQLGSKHYSDIFLARFFITCLRKLIIRNTAHLLHMCFFTPKWAEVSDRREITVGSTIDLQVKNSLIKTKANNTIMGN